MLNITDRIHGNKIILIQYNSDNLEITEAEFGEADTEYMFLTKTFGMEGRDAYPSGVTKLSNYLFLTGVLLSLP